MGDEKRDSVMAPVEKPPIASPRISRPVFAPPRPDARSTPAPRRTVPPLTPSEPPDTQGAGATPEARPSIVPPPLPAVAPAPASARPLTPSERARLLELEAKLSRAMRELVEVKAAQMRAECDRARAERLLRDAEKASSTALGELQSELERARARIDELEAQSVELVRLRERLAEMEARVAAPPTPPPQDDLKRLRGVGPAFEKSLIALGITTFSQIAGFTEEDIQRVARSLKVKPERIRRDDWVGSARALLAAVEKG